MVITLRDPMELPGIVLPAGVYVFKLAESDPNRTVVEVFNVDENHLYSTFLAIPTGDSRQTNRSSVPGPVAVEVEVFEKASAECME